MRHPKTSLLDNRYPAPLTYASIRRKTVETKKVEKFALFQWKELVHVFGQNFEISSSSLLGQIGKEKLFGDVLERKVAVLVHKNIDLKNSKNCF